MVALEAQKNKVEERKKLKEEGVIRTTMDALDGAASVVRGKFSIRKKRERDKRRKEKDLGFETNYQAKLNGKIEEEKEKEGERED